MLNKMMLDFIVVLHFIFVLFIALVPFFAGNYFMILHAVVVPFMMAHWYLNDNNCALTIMEKNLRKAMYGEDPDPNDCFTYNLIAPVYDFKKNNSDMSSIIYIITIGLWLITLYRLYGNWKAGKLQRLEHIIMY